MTTQVEGSLWNWARKIVVPDMARLNLVQILTPHKIKGTRMV
jgi:hypothetical protein